MIAFRTLSSLINNIYLGDNKYGSDQVAQFNNFIGAPQKRWEEEGVEEDDFEEYD